MTTAIIKNLDAWMHQNSAKPIDSFEGCLLDNTLYACKNGTAAIYEKPATTNSSVYFMIFSHSKNKEECIKIENDFYKRMVEVYESII